jgi:hypothetical protein
MNRGGCYELPDTPHVKTAKATGLAAFAAPMTGAGAKSFLLIRR